MDNYLTKPFQPEQLQSVLLEVLTGYQLKKATDNVPKATGEQPQAAGAPQKEAIREHLQKTTMLQPEQIDRILEAALRSIKDCLTKVTAAYTQNNREELGRAAHTLKGTLLQCGFDHLAQKSQVIHTGIRDQAELDYATLISELEQELAPLLALNP
jgi:HPt (histidine-containing phosphotransfer) domain-containing protein